MAARPGQSLHHLAAALPAGLTLEPDPAGSRSDPVELHAFTLRNPAGLAAPLYFLPGLHFDFSATLIRRALRAGQPNTSALLPPEVSRYIDAHGLYS